MREDKKLFRRIIPIAQIKWWFKRTVQSVPVVAPGSKASNIICGGFRRVVKTKAVTKYLQGKFTGNFIWNNADDANRTINIPHNNTSSKSISAGNADKQIIEQEKNKNNKPHNRKEGEDVEIKIACAVLALLFIRELKRAWGWKQRMLAVAYWAMERCGTTPSKDEIEQYTNIVIQNQINDLFGKR